MGTTINLLSSESIKFTSSVGNWSSQTNQLSFTRAKIRPESKSSSLRIYDTTGAGASAIISTTDIPENYKSGDWPIRGFSWVNSEVSGDVTIYLTYVAGGASTTISSTTSVIANNWTLLSVENDAISSDTTTILMRVVTTQTTAGKSIYLSRPGIMSPWAAAQSVAGGEVWLRLPNYLQATDKNQTNPDVPLFRFIETIFTVANDIDSTWQDFRWIPPEDNDRVIKESGLVSPDAALPPVLVWLSQVIGSSLIDPTAAYTPWSLLDPDSDPLTPYTWAEWKTALDENADGNLTWTEIQDYNPAVLDVTTAFRQQINGAYYGYKAGTKESFITAAQSVNLVNTVTVSPMYLGDPFHIKVSILASEGGSTADVAAALINTTPAGFQVTVVAV